MVQTILLVWVSYHGAPAIERSFPVGSLLECKSMGTKLANEIFTDGTEILATTCKPVNDVAS